LSQLPRDSFAPRPLLRVPGDATLASFDAIPSKEVNRTMLTSLYLRLRELLNREEGQGMVEYALILVLIAVVVIVVLIVLGNQVKNVFCNISGGLGQ
jgi:pilus assembly protein Flp/PilA